MRYFIRVREIKDKVDILERELDKIDSNINQLEKIKEKLEWYGDAANVFYICFDNYLAELRKTEQNVINSIAFLAEFYNQYSDEYIKLSRKYSLEDTYDKV